MSVCGYTGPFGNETSKASKDCYVHSCRVSKRYKNSQGNQADDERNILVHAVEDGNGAQESSDKGERESTMGTVDEELGDTDMIPLFGRLSSSYKPRKVKILSLTRHACVPRLHARTTA